MGGGTIQRNKPHKARYATKGQRNSHFKAIKHGGAPFKGGMPNRQVAKSQRIQRAKTLRDQKRAELLQEKRSGGVSSGCAPRIVALIGLSAELNMRSVKQRFLSLCSADSSDIAEANLATAAHGAQQVQDWMEYDDNANEIEDEQRTSGNQEGYDDQGLITLVMARHRTRVSVIEASSKDILRSLEIVKIADMVLFFVPAVPRANSGCIDKSGMDCLTVMRAQGLPVVCGVIVGSNKAVGKKMGEAKKAAIAAVHGQLTSDVKVFAVDSNDECRQMLRHVAEQRISSPSWRSQRPHVVTEKIEILATEEEAALGSKERPGGEQREGGGGTETSTCRLFVSGYLRGRAISVNQLVHVSGLGDFQMEKIEGPPDPIPLNPRSGKSAERQKAVNGEAADMAVDVGIDVEAASAGKIRVLAEADPAIREPLVVANTPDPLAGEQTWPTESELAEASERARKMGKALRRKRRLKGLSDYQAAWIVDSDDDGEGRGDEEEADDMERLDGDEGDGEDRASGGDFDMEDDGKGDAESEMWTDEQTGTDLMDGTEDGEDGMTPAQREAEIKRLKAAAREDEEFPDEVDTPTDIPARERFAKYRGLKSFRTSPWDPKESLPREYAKIFAFDDYKRTLKHVHAKADLVDRMEVPGTVAPGTYVRLHVVGVPRAAAEALISRTVGVGLPAMAVGLLQHESKMSVLHFSLKKWDGCREPVKSKEKLTFHIGFRQFSARPIFSSDDMQMDKHKFERFLHPGRHVVGSIFSPIMFPPAPVLVFKERMGSRSAAGEDGVSSVVSGAGVSADGNDEKGMRMGTGQEPQLVATGVLRGPDADRIILKKIVLSGYPLRVHKKKAVVRFMFHNPEDVRWFRPLELWTKYGRRGRIREPVGTHGNMKCMFDGILQQRDSVCVSLYKRVYPKWPENDEDERNKSGR
ncbi:hypothetical protein CBR_g46902 [Chara braunii]|uniref:Bms1-type G domain-containing protein n=1 Tax=Chara braunii TaxID=69332 RepID=A0A388M178_CHABU|nr:hypothetical protein CBR_g46902 [Chara braunii]|eukprot:GBG88337.1 hypothetical protein CBR_g46902 [Chara braunii]